MQELRARSLRISSTSKARTDRKVKREVTQVLHDMGLTVSDAIRLPFAHIAAEFAHIAAEKGCPFPHVLCELRLIDRKPVEP